MADNNFEKVGSVIYGSKLLNRSLTSWVNWMAKDIEAAQVHSEIATAESSREIWASYSQKHKLPL